MGVGPVLVRAEAQFLFRELGPMEFFGGWAGLDSVPCPGGGKGWQLRGGVNAAMEEGEGGCRHVISCRMADEGSGHMDDQWSYG
jgi:hypothetical protein